MSGKEVPRPRNLRAPSQGAFQTFLLVFFILFVTGYLVGYLTKDTLFSSGATELRTTAGGAVDASAQHASISDIKATATEVKQLPKKAASVKSAASATPAKQHKWDGYTVHSLLTSSGDSYQNFQTRIMYGTYKLVQKMPGGERLTGFTRILHRTVPDMLMEEVPTFLAKPLKPQCDGWCDYPVANRPDAIWQWVKAASQNESMIQGAWIYMLECDYVWMKPVQPMGSAWDPSVPGAQYWYDYIIPTHPNAIPSMKKLYDGKPEDIPPSGPAPVLMRFSEWLAITPDYVKASAKMEADEEMKKRLEWVREMYAWDAAVAMHKEVKIKTQKPPESITIVQPPFDEGLFNASLCHYTWGALYHEGLPSKGAKQVYRWEKRDFNDIKFVLKVPNIPMPPEYKDGWILEFDAPLTRPRHDTVVLMLTQMNKAIDTLPDLTEHWKQFEPKLNEMVRARDEAWAKAAKEKAAAAKATRKMRLQ